MRYNDIFYQNLSNDNHSGSVLFLFFCDFLFIFFISFPIFLFSFSISVFFCDTIGIAGNVLGGVWRKILWNTLWNLLLLGIMGNTIP